LRYLSADVVVQVAGEMENKMAKTVSEWEGLSPELFVGERSGQVTDC